MKTIKRKPVNLTSPVQFSASEADNSPRRFNILAYTGAVISTYFGNLVFDIAGMSSKPKIPILREHARDRIVGFGKGAQDGKVFSVSGEFSQSTDDAEECLGLADEGYPWQASVGVRPVKIKSLAEKEEASVNGKTVKGPGEIWLQTEVGEVSFVSLGADSNTSISVFSESADEIEVELESMGEQIAPTIQNEGVGAMPAPNKETRTMTKEELQAQAPDLAAALKAEGIAEERSRVTQILASDPEMKHLTVLKQAIEAGTSAEGIFKSLFEAERQFRLTGLKNLSDQATPSVGQSRTEGETAADTRTFFGEVDAAMKTHNLSRADAVRKIQSEQPKLHHAFLDQQKK